MNCNVFSAIFQRNFVSYFSNPTGYVFIVVFVVLNSLCAFWPSEFFNSNLANLDQLNAYLPFVMLVFIPAITMSVWAEERRQGTDELLLTIPASDLDVVLGKFCAALAIFSVSLGFSMVANYCVLSTLGRPDFGLFIGTYVGYWMVGMAMLATGMVASFLTSNLTVGFILGAIFCAPLAFSAYLETLVKQPVLLDWVRRLTLSEQVRDFTRGVLSLSSTVYFVAITVVMLYLAVVLIGRRHWVGGRDGRPMLGHFIVRGLSLTAVAVAAISFFGHHDWIRPDITSERLSSLSPHTKKQIRELDAKHPIKIEAYISPHVPREYVQQRLNLLSTLEEFKALGGEKIQVTIHSIEPFSEEASLAEQKYGITPQRVLSTSRGARTEEEIYLATAFTSGLDKVVLPFVDKGIPVEYELVRSICTVAQQERKTIGILKTDAPLYGRFNMQTMSSSQNQMIIGELEKQYDVVEVDASSPITRRYDALLAVQPSSLNPQQMNHLIDAIRSGQPTAVFEDPLPAFFSGVSGTTQPRRPQQPNPMMFGRQPPQQPKGDIHQLWDLLGVDMIGDGESIVWQDYNPYPKASEFIDPEWVFVDAGSGAETPFNATAPISSRLQQVLFVYPGSWRKLNRSKLDFTELAQTGSRTGTVDVPTVMSANRATPGGRQQLAFARDLTQEQYVLAAHIRGRLPKAKAEADADGATKPEQASATDSTKASEADATESTTTTTGEPAVESTEKSEPTETKEPEINVVLVADIDCLFDAFFALRSRGMEEEDEIQWNFDNVTFVLNTLDVLADDDRFVEIRKRRRPHRTLEKVELRTEDARSRASERRERFNREFASARDEEQQKFDEQIAKIEKREDLNPRDKQIQAAIARRDGQQRLDARVAQLKRKRDREIKKIERDLTLEIQKVQDSYKFWAVVIPPIPPLLVGLFVFFHRRQQEREGVSSSRLR